MKLQWKLKAEVEVWEVGCGMWEVWAVCFLVVPWKIRPLHEQLHTFVTVICWITCKLNMFLRVLIALACIAAVLGRCHRKNCALTASASNTLVLQDFPLVQAESMVAP